MHSFPTARRPARPGSPPSVAAIALMLLFAGAFAPAPGEAQQRGEDWCETRGRDHGHCEVREFTLQPGDGSLTVLARPNGGITVEGWDGAEVRVAARVTARAGSRSAAVRLAEEVTIEAEPGRIRSDGPRIRGRGSWQDESWEVSYRILVPTGTELDLETLNGSIRVSGVNGSVSARTTNGGVRLADVDGPVRVRSTNGSVEAGFRDGSTLRYPSDFRTTNGSVTVSLPAGLSAQLEASTTNGSIHTDFPVTVRGRIGRSLSAVLGDGGPELRLRTTNGSIRLRQG